MTYVDALGRISQIEQQLAQLSGATASQIASGSAAAATTTAGAPSTSSFADALAQAQGTGYDSGDVASLDGSDANALGSTASSPLTLSQLSGVLGLTGGVGLPVASSEATLPAAAGTMLTSDQRQFASRLASDTGLDPGVICAWLLSEENGSAAQSRQSADNNDWLNIGYTGDGTYGSSDSIWSDPTSAADATAGWLKGRNTIPGYGTASSGIQAITSSAGQSPAAQMSAIQTSGWAGSGYPDLPGVYAEVTGGGQTAA
ncbi:MAG: hypothetical protein ACLP01_02565 [Solirubrobacteraceae bacterium]